MNAIRAILPTPYPDLIFRYAEIEATLHLEKEISKSGWKDLVSTPGT